MKNVARVRRVLNVPILVSEIEIFCAEMSAEEDVPGQLLLYQHNGSLNLFQYIRSHSIENIRCVFFFAKLCALMFVYIWFTYLRGHLTFRIHPFFFPIFVRPFFKLFQFKHPPNCLLVPQDCPIHLSFWISIYQTNSPRNAAAIYLFKDYLPSCPVHVNT